MKSQTIYVGIGTNLGDRESNHRTAITMLNETNGVSVNRESSLKEYPPMGPEQPDYLNGAVELETTLLPEQMLLELNRIEVEMGRVRVVHWGPRIVDLDILFWGDLILKTERLTIPHPGAYDRLFVLEPLAELCPELVDPISGKTISTLLSSLRS